MSNTQNNARRSQQMKERDDRLDAHEDQCAERYAYIISTLEKIQDSASALKSKLFQVSMWVAGGVFATLIAIIFFLIESQ